MKYIIGMFIRNLIGMRPKLNYVDTRDIYRYLMAIGYQPNNRGFLKGE